MAATSDYPSFDSPRLILRGFRDDDLAFLQSFAVRPAFWRYLPGPEMTPDLIAAYFEARLEAQAMGEGGDWHFALESRDLGFILGTARLTIQSREHGHGNVAVSLDSDHWGLGLGREAMGALSHFALEVLGLHRLSGLVDAENKPAQRMMETNGFEREGLLRQNFRLRGVWRDSLLYARLAAA